MKFIKTMILAGFLLGTVGMCLQAQEQPQDRVFQGKKAKMIVLESLAGTNMVNLSRNEKYIYGDLGEGGEAGYIYEIATGTLKVYEGFSFAEVIDTNNYVASNHIMKNGRRIEFKKQNLPTDREHDYGASCASADLNVISYDTYIGANYVSVIFDGEGNIIDTMPHFEPNLGGGYGSFVMAMTPDGMMMAGRTSMAEAHTNFTPAIWDRYADKTVATTIGDVLDDDCLLDGTMYGINDEGTIAVGELTSLPYWVEYNKSNQQYKMNEIPTFPGYQIGWGSMIQDSTVLGMDQLDHVSVYERVPWLYNIKSKEKVSFHDHLLYRYGLEENDIYPYFTVRCFSKNHKIFVGFSYNVAWYPYLIILEDEQVHPVVRNVSIHQPYKQPYVQLNWEAPLNGDYTVAGYKVYCDSVCIATIEDAKTLSYRHNDVIPGIHNYQVQAFYTDGEASDYSPEKKIFTVDENGCLPVQEINAKVIYNRTIDLTWGRPSANILQKSAAPAIRKEERTSVAKGGAAREPKYMVDGKLDYVSLMDMLSEHAAVGVRATNGYLYVGNYRTNIISVYNAISGNLMRQVEVDNLYGMFDMTYHNNTLYCVGADSKNITMLSINPRDPYDITFAGTIQTPTNLTHISYLEGLNDGEDMIMTGNFNTIKFYKGDAAIASDTADFHKTFDIKGMTIIGTAYHNGRLFIANQHDGNSSLVETFDWETGKHLFTTDLVAIPALAEVVAASQGYSALMSGISIGQLEDGTVVLDAMVQPLVAYNQLVTVEVESSPDVKGFIVYRDGVKVSDTVKARHFSEVIFEPGTYAYTVEYISENCSIKSDGFAVDSATIVPIGTCMPPTQVKVFESNEIACLSWDVPSKVTDPNIVGFNVYRNGEQLCERVLELRFNDEAIEKGKEYIYRVEAFYDNSCVASDSVKITPTFEGYAEAPAAVAVKVNEKTENNSSYTSTTTWDLPNFEEPMALGYCGSVPGGVINLDGTNTVYGLIGWTQLDNDLEPYKDLYIVGIEFMIGAPVNSINGVVYIDNRLVWSEPMNRVSIQQWHKHFFKKSFSMNQKVEIATGYAFSFNLENTTDGIIVYDMGPAVANKGDILSPDGVDIYSLKGSGVDANLMINALVVRKRDLEQASKMEDGMEYLKTKAFSTGALKITEPRPIQNAPKTTSESYTLKGFNVYRDGEKRNQELLKTFSFEDNGLVAGGEYEYVVSAVYADQEVKSEGVWISGVANSEAEAVCPVSFLPNPVQDMLYIFLLYKSPSHRDLST
ncbi:MAG: hypothetical protein K2I87_00040, partial [Bacteroidales bacterium]|nr:hypothetical protein [Bacteroidales bacterium]